MQVHAILYKELQYPWGIPNVCVCAFSFKLNRPRETSDRIQEDYIIS